MWLQVGPRGMVGIDSHHRYTEVNNLRTDALKPGWLRNASN